MLRLDFVITLFVTLRNNRNKMENEKQSKSYRLILDTAQPLFWKHGVKRVSVEEICKEAGVSKMTFYRNFKNKMELIEQIMKELFQHGLKEYNAVMNQDIPFAQKIEQIILKKFENTEDLSQEFIQEMYINGDEKIQKMIIEFTNATLIQFKNDMLEAQKKGYIRKDIKIELLMKMREVMANVMADDAFIALYKTPQEAIIEITRFYFYGMMNSEEAKK